MGLRVIGEDFDDSCGVNKVLIEEGGEVGGCGEDIARLCEFVECHHVVLNLIIGLDFNHSKRGI